MGIFENSFFLFFTISFFLYKAMEQIGDIGDKSKNRRNRLESLQIRVGWTKKKRDPTGLVFSNRLIYLQIRSKI